MKDKRLLMVLTLGGLLAFLAWAVMGPPEFKGDIQKVAITELEIADQAALWERTWGRPPSSAELKQAVVGYIRSEILYKEALALGLDREDPRIRIVLIQKMQLLAASKAEVKEVREEDLAAFYALRQEQYRLPARFSITQIFIKNAEDNQERAKTILKALQEENPSDDKLLDVGDSTMLDAIFIDVTATEVEKQFGADFTAEALSFPEGEWSGPVKSPYGLHLVKVFNRISSRIPELSEVLDKVEDDLRYESAKAAEDQGYQEIAGKYRVVYTEAAEEMLESMSP